MYRVAQGVGCHFGACVDGGSGSRAAAPAASICPTVAPTVQSAVGGWGGGEVGGGSSRSLGNAWTPKLFETAACVLFVFRLVVPGNAEGRPGRHGTFP